MDHLLKAFQDHEAKDTERFAQLNIRVDGLERRIAFAVLAAELLSHLANKLLELL